MSLGYLVVSPCIGVCALDEQQHCRGCGRHIDEIIAWPTMSELERRAVMQRLDTQRPEYKPAR